MYQPHACSQLVKRSLSLSLYQCSSLLPTDPTSRISVQFLSYVALAKDHVCAFTRISAVVLCVHVCFTHLIYSCACCCDLFDLFFSFQDVFNVHTDFLNLSVLSKNISCQIHYLRIKHIFFFILLLHFIPFHFLSFQALWNIKFFSKNWPFMKHSVTSIMWF